MIRHLLAQHLHILRSLTAEGEAALGVEGALPLTEAYEAARAVVEKLMEGREVRG